MRGVCRVGRGCISEEEPGTEHSRFIGPCVTGRAPRGWRLTLWRATDVRAVAGDRRESWRAAAVAFIAARHLRAASVAAHLGGPDRLHANHPNALPNHMGPHARTRHRHGKSRTSPSSKDGGPSPPAYMRGVLPLQVHKSPPRTQMSYAIRYTQHTAVFPTYNHDAQQKEIRKDACAYANRQKNKNRKRMKTKLLYSRVQRAKTRAMYIPLLVHTIVQTQWLLYG